jgi:uncharacterized protein with ATP-grasp and redox domains
MPKPEMTNARMCEIASLRVRNQHLEQLVKDKDKLLRRAYRELETLSTQYGDNSSKGLIERIKQEVGDNV